jgi:hypothetical protein
MVCVVLSELGKKRDPEAVQHIIPLLSRTRIDYAMNAPPPPTWLKQSYPYVHQRAAIALAEIGTKDALDALIAWGKLPQDGPGLENVILAHLGLELNPYRRYSTVSEALKAILSVMADIEEIADDKVRNDSRYRSFSDMREYWHVFEGSFEDCAAHLTEHLKRDHAGSQWSFDVKNYGMGMRGITAGTKSSGYNHFVWRTAPDFFVLLVSDNS